jgi:hypothetical protein
VTGPGSAVDVEATVTGLLPGRTYHARLVVGRGAEQARGPDVAFRTPPIPGFRLGLGPGRPVACGAAVRDACVVVPGAALRVLGSGLQPGVVVVATLRRRVGGDVWRAVGVARGRISATGGLVLRLVVPAGGPALYRVELRAGTTRVAPPRFARAG